MPITHDLPMADYLAMPALGSSTAFEVISKSPAHARHCQLMPDQNCSIADVGTIAHRLLLEGHEANIVLIDADDWRTKDAREQRETAYADGKTPLLARQMPEIRKMVEATRAFVKGTEIAGVFDRGKPEVTVTWNERGVECKARPDYLSDDFYISLKTTNGSADPASFVRRQVGPMGYDFGLMFYQLGLKANGINVQPRLLVIEQNAPYGCCLIELSALRERVCEAKAQRAIRTWGECLMVDHFPAYEPKTYEADLTPWEINEAEDNGYLSLTIGA